MRSKMRTMTPEFFFSPCAFPAAGEEFLEVQVLVLWEEHRFWRPVDLGLNLGFDAYGVLCAARRPGSLR